MPVKLERQFGIKKKINFILMKHHPIKKFLVYIAIQNMHYVITIFKYKDDIEHTHVICLPIQFLKVRLSPMTLNSYHGYLGESIYRQSYT